MHQRAMTWGKTWPYKGNPDGHTRGLPMAAYGELSWPLTQHIGNAFHVFAVVRRP